MKSKIIVAALFSFFCTVNTKAQFIIKVRPSVIVNSRPIPPGRNMVWIEPEYVWQNGNYVMINGFWASPKYGHRYIPGNWRRKRGGYIWVPGRWRRF